MGTNELNDKDTKDKITFSIKKETSNSKGILDDEVICYYIEKSRYSTCKIENCDIYGSGFFCKIPYTKDNNILLNVLVTCEHVLYEEIIFSEKDIKLIINNKEKIISLKKQKKMVKLRNGLFMY